MKDNIEKLLGSDVINVGGSTTDSIATLILYEKNIEININEITTLLGCEPTETHRKGDIYRYGRKETTAKIGLWILDAPKKLNFVMKIKYLLSKTVANKDIWIHLSKIYDIQLRSAIFLHSWTEGFELENKIISKMAKRHWKFVLSIYSAGGDEIVNAFLRKNR
ncbi:MAG: DUF4279 domain-containing protein [Planctomycetaceae bacterium]|jgi:hypothetical protein|nr:DUF4279 domain-containing protein [Planctomycetaceae bacterium]